MASASNDSVGGRPGVNILNNPGGSNTLGFEIPGVGWKYLKELQHWPEIIRKDAASVGKVGRSLGI